VLRHADPAVTMEIYVEASWMPLRRLAAARGVPKLMTSLQITRRARTRALSSDWVLVRRVVVGLRGLKLDPALLAYVTDGSPAREPRRPGRRQERRVSKRLPAQTIEYLIAEYAAGTTALSLASGTASPRVVCFGCSGRQ
jgi:hypothetical protein